MLNKDIMSFLPGMIWGCWLIFLSGFGGAIKPPLIDNGLQVVFLTATGGYLTLLLASNILIKKKNPISNYRKYYATIGVFEFLQSTFFFTERIS